MAYTTIKKPSDYFNTKLYTGDGSSSRSITNVNFKPDWTWVKSRNSSDYDHMVTDVVRGTPKMLKTNSSAAEDANPGAGGIGSFDSDGFTIAAGSINNTNMNNNGTTYVGWNWLANGAGSSNTDGTITSTVSANTTSGFSIAKYTGTGANASFGHGLGTTPAVYILKSLSGVSTWLMYHQSLGIGYHLGLNNTSAQAANDATFANNTAPDTSKIYLGNWGDLNANGSDFICYSFAEKQGFSKFGSYVGTNSDDGTFLYLGFKPAFIMVKAVSGSNSPGSQNWVILDNKRSSSGGNNVVQYKLFPNASDAENTAENNHADFLSNGVKFRGGNDATNANNTYIYMAFAEAPLVGTNGITAKAR